MDKKYTVAAFYFPQWHHDRYHTQAPEWTEWETLKNAVPRFEGHNQPKTPVWGYLDESLPSTSEIQIEAASSNGIDVFIYDWYWDMVGENTGCFLNSALEKGFMKAKNSNKMRFGLMLCNHNPLSRSRWDAMCDYIIEHYFGSPLYWELDGEKYFSIYQLYTLIEGLGGIENTLDALNGFREKAARRGYKLHINFVEWGLQNEAVIGRDRNAVVNKLGASSVTSYVWIHNYEPLEPLHAPYSVWRDGAIPCWDRFDKQFDVDYYPNVSQGWDSSGRYAPDEKYQTEHGAYYMTIMDNNTPEEFKLALYKCRDFLDRCRSKHKIVTLYAWNEWTEGGYLEPEAKYGYAYLEAIKEVFA